MIVMHDRLSFPCSQCGECCRHIEHIPQLAAFDRGDGVCKYLVGNLCSIYKTRPNVCRVDVMYETYFYDQYTRAEFYRLNALGCDMLKNNCIKKENESAIYKRGTDIEKLETESSEECREEL